MHRTLGDCRFDDAAPTERFALTQKTGTSLRVDRTEVQLSLLGRTESPRVTILLTSAQEVHGRVVRDSALLTAVMAETHPILGVRSSDPCTWLGRWSPQRCSEAARRGATWMLPVTRID